MCTQLKDEIYYSNLYDRLTVDECRRLEKSGISEDFAEIKDKKSKKDKIKKEFEVTVVLPILLYFKIGERYAKKSAKILGWMDLDRVRDEKLANAVSPQGVHCLSCSTLMEETMRDLLTGVEEKDERILFMFECSACGKRRGIYEDGKEFRYEPEPCSECRSARTHKYSRKDNVITTTYTCLACGKKEVDVWDMNEKKKSEKPDPNFAKDRVRFCMSEEEGKKYIDGRIRLEHVAKLFKEEKEREQNKDLYDAVAKIKKLTIVELEKLLTPILKKTGYIKLELSNPEIDRDVIVPFTIRDSKSGRESLASEYNLKRLIKKILQNTNWRLMSNGVNYRLGILTGRLRGYENEEDLLKLIKQL